MAGLAGLHQDTQAKLKKNLAGQSAPPNPQTPIDRTDPTELFLLDMKRVQRALDVTLQAIPEADPRELLFSAMSACVSRLLKSVHLSDAVDVLLERLFPLSSDDLKKRVAQMYAPISPPIGLGGGVPGAPPAPSLAGGDTGQPPIGGGPPPPGGPPGVVALPG